MIQAEERRERVELVQEGRRKGVRAHAIADLIGLCSRTLRRRGIALAAHGFNQDGRKGSIRLVGKTAGFVERLAPDILESWQVRAQESGIKTRPPQPCGVNPASLPTIFLPAPEAVW